MELTRAIALVFLMVGTIGLQGCVRPIPDSEWVEMESIRLLKPKGWSIEPMKQPKGMMGDIMSRGWKAYELKPDPRHYTVDLTKFSDWPKDGYLRDALTTPKVNAVETSHISMTGTGGDVISWMAWQLFLLSPILKENIEVEPIHATQIGGFKGYCQTMRWVLGEGDGPEYSVINVVCSLMQSTKPVGFVFSYMEDSPPWLIEEINGMVSSLSARE